MAVRNIISGLKANSGLRKKLSDIYEDLGTRLEHYMDFTEHQMRVLIVEGVQETYDNLKARGVTIPASPAFLSPGGDRQAIKNVADQVFRSYMTVSRLTRIFRKYSFTVVQTFKAARHASKKVAVITKLANGYRVTLPTPKSRMEGVGGMGGHISANLPALFDAGAGPTNDIGKDLVEKTFKKYFKLTAKKLSRGRYSIRGGGGFSMAQSTLKSNVSNKSFTKMHGGDAVSPLQMANPDLDPQSRNIEATTAHLVNNIEQLKAGDFSLTGTTQDHIDQGIIKIAEAMDAEFVINGTTISDIVENNKNIVVGVTMGYKGFNIGTQNLMFRADKSALDVYYAALREHLLRELSDPEARTSKSMKDLHTERAAQSMVKNIMLPLTKKGKLDMRFKVNKALIGKKKTTKKEQAQFQEQFAALTTLMTTKPGKAVPKGKRSKKETTGKYNPRNPASDTSLAALMQMVNKALPRHLKRNMEPPALQYRGRGNPSKPFAGPFNRGVRVQNIRDFKDVQGGLDIQYTYEKYPYQTFEPGFEKGSVLRDPRKLIEESIRDIMIERKQTRFLNMRRI